MRFPWQRQPPNRIGESSLRLRRIFDDTQDLAWRGLRRFGVPAERVEDSFQQVYLIAAERLDDIQPGSERAFIYGVALRLARSYHRVKWREVPEEDCDLRESDQPNAEAMFDRQRLVETCDRILAILTQEEREVFVLHELEGLSGRQISELVDIPEGTVHSRLRRARLRVGSAVAALAKTSPAPGVHRG